MKGSLKYILAGVLASLQMHLAEAKQPPNVVLIVCDELNDYLTGIPGGSTPSLLRSPCE